MANRGIVTWIEFVGTTSGAPPATQEWFLRPDADSIDGNWLNQSGSNVDLFASLDEITASDTDYIESPLAPVAETCRLAMSNPPGVVSQPVIVSYRFNLINGVPLTVRLLQGTTTIASWVETTGSGWTTSDRTLTGLEFAAISDFTNLFVELEANAAPPPALDIDFTTGTLDSRITFTRASSGRYYNSSGVLSTAATDVPRFDYNPATLVARGLLIEEQRTNYCPHSQDFADAAWAVFGCTKNGVAPVADPMGGSNAYSITFNSTGGAIGAAAAIYQLHAVDFVPTISTSFYLRSPSGTKTVRVGFYDGSSTDYGTADTTIYDDRWTRVELLNQPVASAPNTHINVRNNVAGTTGTVYVFGAQSEAGAFATSYIPTTTVVVTRAADAAVMTGTNFSSWFGASAGTFVARFDGPASGTCPIISADDNTANEVIMLYGSGTDPKAIVTDGGATQADLDTGTLTANTVAKLALSFAANDFAACFNGGTVAVDTGGTLPTVTQARLGAGPAGNYLNGHLASVKVYNIAKTDAELQALTT